MNIVYNKTRSYIRVTIQQSKYYNSTFLKSLRTSCSGYERVLAEYPSGDKLAQLLC